MVYSSVGRRPAIELNQYWRTKGGNTNIRCKAYSSPPVPPYAGTVIHTFEPGTVMGPVTAYVHTPRFATILVDDFWWVNVWAARRDPYGWSSDGTYFAYLERPTHSLSNHAPVPPRNGLLDDDGVERIRRFADAFRRIRQIDAVRAEGVGDDDRRPSSSRGSASRSPLRSTSAPRTSSAFRL